MDELSSRLMNGIECSSVEKHTPCPEGFIDWHDWAKKMGKTHVQVKCDGCGLYTIWVERTTHSIDTVKSK